LTITQSAEVEDLVTKKPKTLEEAQCKSQYSAFTFFQKGKIIFENRADYFVFPASLTKLMTAYLVFENLQNKKLFLEQKIRISAKAAEISSINKVTTLKLVAGDSISIEDALKGMIVKSFNGAAVSLSETIAGSEWKFVQMMNKKAKEINMKFSNFRNASGFHEFGQFTTNHDLAKLTKAIINDFPQYYYIFSIKNIEIDEKEFTSHNVVLLENDNVEGMKTGFTSMSGYNLVSTAKAGDNKVISILTSCESSYKRNEFMLYLLELAKKDKI
jgi:D-alanyl-D-alanine carboxypeptidase